MLTTSEYRQMCVTDADSFAEPLQNQRWYFPWLHDHRCYYNEPEWKNDIQCNTDFLQAQIVDPWERHDFTYASKLSVIVGQTWFFCLGSFALVLLPWLDITI